MHCKRSRSAADIFLQAWYLLYNLRIYVHAPNKYFLGRATIHVDKKIKTNKRWCQSWKCKSVSQPDRLRTGYERKKWMNFDGLTVWRFSHKRQSTLCRPSDWRIRRHCRNPWRRHHEVAVCWGLWLSIAVQFDAIRHRPTSNHPQRPVHCLLLSLFEELFCSYWGVWWKVVRWAWWHLPCFCELVSSCNGMWRSGVQTSWSPGGSSTGSLVDRIRSESKEEQ